MGDNCLDYRSALWLGAPLISPRVLGGVMVRSTSTPAERAAKKHKRNISKNSRRRNMG